MEDFGQLIAIIVGIIFLVINSLGKKKKPNSASPNTVPTKSQQPRNKTGIPELDVLFEELTQNEEELDNYEKDILPEYETLETIEPDSPYAAYNSTNTVASHSNYEKIGEYQSTISTNYFEDTEVAKNEEVANNFNFNLRDAVLFSEILKRPSY